MEITLKDDFTNGHFSYPIPGITPFKNILNDMYSRDISKKVLAGITTRSRQGKFCGGQPPLGLMRDPEDKGHLILDPETAPVIRKIYDMALDGWGG